MGCLDHREGGRRGLFGLTDACPLRTKSVGGGSSHQGSRPRSFSSWSLDHIARISFLFGLFGPQRWTLSAHDEISESSESTY